MIKKEQLVLSLLFFSMLIFLIPNVRGQAYDIYYTFESDNLYSHDSLQETGIGNSVGQYPYFNSRNSTSYSQDYYGNYSFENDVGLYNTSIPYLTTVSPSGNGGCFAEVLSEFDGHDSVLNCTYTVGSGNHWWNHDLDTTWKRYETAYVEYWIQISDLAGGYHSVYGRDSSYNILYHVEFRNSNFYYYDGSSATDSGIDCTSDVWYHIRVFYNITSELWSFWVNGENAVTDADFRNSGAGELDAHVLMYNVKDSSVYLDAISFDIGNHYVGMDNSFNDEVGVSGTSIDYVDLDTMTSGGGWVEVNFSHAGHHSVIHAESNNAWSYINNDIPDYATGGIGFWYYANEISSKTVTLIDGANNFLELQIVNGGEVRAYIYGVGGVHFDYYNVGEWNYFQILWNCSTDLFDICVNGNWSYQVDYKREPLVDYVDVDNVKFYAHAGDGFYLDGIIETNEGYTLSEHLIPYWYDLGENIIPELETDNSTIEVDRWEFAFSDFPTLYSLGSDTFSDWTESDSGDSINIAYDPEAVWYGDLGEGKSDRKIEFHEQVGSSSDVYIERDFDADYGIVNITWSLNYTTFDSLGDGDRSMMVYSSDDTLVAEIFHEFTNLCYKDSGMSDVNLKTGFLTDGEIYSYNLYINYNDELAVLNHYIDGVYDDTYLIPLIATGKDGLGKVRFENNYDPVREQIYYIDYIGVYVNGTSQSTEMGWLHLSTDVGIFHDYWEFALQPYFRTNFTGDMALHLTDWFYYTSSSPMEQLLPRFTHVGYNLTNVYDHTFNGVDHIYTPLTWVEFYDDVTFTNISMSGFYLDATYGGRHNPTFTFSNVDNTESYFYVENNILYWECYFDEGATEYIEVEFNVVNLACESRSMSYTGHENETGYAYLTADYTTHLDMSRALPNYQSTWRTILNQDAILTKVKLTVTDDGEFSSGYNTGQLNQIRIIYNPEYGLSLAVGTLLSALIPLILTMIGTVAVYTKLGKDSILPMLMVFSFVCWFVDLIPAWLFIILEISFLIALIYYWREIR